MERFDSCVLYSNLCDISWGESSAAIRQLLPRRLASINWQTNNIYLEKRPSTSYETISRKVVKMNINSSSANDFAELFRKYQYLIDNKDIKY